jgi:hypothetical protein
MEKGPDKQPEEEVRQRRGITSIAEVHIDDFEAAQRDPALHDFLAESQAQGEALEAKGLIHPN